MAKKQSFGDKVKGKKEVKTKTIKLVYSVRSEKTGQWRFSEKFVQVSSDEDEAKVLEEAMK